MVNSEKMSENRPRNINAEWAILKDMAKYWMPTSSMELDGGSREKYREYGQKVLDIVNMIPDRPDEELKVQKIDEVYQAAEDAGIKDSLDKSMNFKRVNLGYERIGRETFGDNVDLTPEEERRVEELRDRVIDMPAVAPGILAEEFPSGNYLYHGSTVPRLEKIFQTGSLKNGVALAEDDPEVSALNMNSGFEGVSWSMNQIDALPGSTGHVAGFLSAPENLLDDTCLVVPSRPAPYEVLQVSKGINPQELYALKNQLETWGDGGVSLGEKNNVDSNLMRMLMCKEGSDFLGQSLVYDYTGDLSADELRKYYTIDNNGKMTWDSDIYQKSEVPPALPWMQMLIDRKVFANNGYAALDSVEKVVDYAKNNQDFIRILLATERETVKSLNERYGKMLDDAEAVRIWVDQMYFVTSHADLDDWLKVMARTGANPKGILLYDDDQVVLENFASQYEGNHKELSRIIGRTVDVNDDFWRNEMGMDPENIPRSGHRGQVLLESAVKRDKVIQLNNEGKIEVVGLEQN